MIQIRYNLTLRARQPVPPAIRTSSQTKLLPVNLLLDLYLAKFLDILTKPCEITLINKE